MNKLFNKIGVAIVGMAMAVGVGVAIGRSGLKEVKAADLKYTYTLSDANWGTTVSPSNDITWTSSGNFDEKNSSGACVAQNHVATGVSSAAFTNLKSVKLSGKTNSQSTGKMAVYTSPTVDGVYTIVGEEKTYSASTTIAETFTLDAAATVFVKIVVTSTTSNASKWIYLKSFDITCAESVSNDYIADSLTISPSAALSVNEDDVIDVSGYTITGSKNGAAAAVLASSDYTFQGCGTGTGSNFNMLSKTKFVNGATRLQWKANYPTTQGGSTYAYVGIDVTVKVEQVEYNKVTDNANLSSGKKYLLVEETVNSNKYYAMKNVSSNLGQCAEITLDTTNHKIASKANKGDAVEYTLGGSSTDGWTLYSSGVYLSYSGSSNNLYTSATASSNNEKWTIDVANGSISNKATSTRKLQFNYNNGNPRFACYTTTQVAVYLYERVELEPALDLAESLEGYAGETGKSLTVTAHNYVPDTFVWTSSNESVVTVSGSTATANLSFIAEGSSNVKVTASKGSTIVEKTCVVTVKAVPTEVVVKVNNEPIEPTYVMEQWEGSYRDPNVSINPEGANQNYILAVQSETVPGAFTVAGGRINFVKPATGVIRITSAAKSSIYFDLNVKCNEDEYTADTLSYSGTPVSQIAGYPFDSSGLSYSIKKSSGTKSISKNDLTFSPSIIELDTTTVIASHAASGQTVEISVSVTQPISVTEALAVVNALDDNAKTTQKYTVMGIVSRKYSVSSKSQTYWISNDGKTTSDELEIYKGKWIGGADMTDEAYLDAGDKVYVSGYLKKYIDNNSNVVPEFDTGANLAKVTIYYSAIKEWVGNYLLLDDYTTSSGYCKDSEHHYYASAKSALKTVETNNPGAIDEFESNDEDDFKAAYARYVAWAEANGDAAPFDGNATIVNGIARLTNFNSDSKGATIIIVIASAVAISTIGGIFFIRRRKEDK